MIQKMGMTVLIVLPGLILHYAKDKDSPLNAKTMRKVLRHTSIKALIHKHSLSAVLLDYFILPHIRDNPRKPPDGDEERALQKRPSMRTLAALIRDGYFSKSMTLARLRHLLLHPGANATPPKQRPTVAKIKEVAVHKFPIKDADMDALPSIVNMPR